MMKVSSILRTTGRHLGLATTLLSMMANLADPSALAAQPVKPRDALTTTPIQHVIVIIGENRTFDHLFATYVPPAGQTVDNLLSKGIVNADGTPGPNFNLATQYHANITQQFQLSPQFKAPWAKLPPTNVQFSPINPSDTNPAPFQSLTAALDAEPGLESGDYGLLLTGATGMPFGAVDTRVKNVFNLRNGPYQLTPTLSYDDYAGSPVHRFYQMWQQQDCSVKNATPNNPSGCLSDLFPYVEVSVGAGSNGAPRPSPFNWETTLEGSIAMGFYNVQQGDMPYFNTLAQTYAISDNYHQPFAGGTGANSFMLGSGDAIYYSDGQGNVATPSSNQIENPDPMPGTNNWYTQDGYSGGTYSNCSDRGQPGVREIVSYLNTLAYKPNPNCARGAYYLLNNYAPGYFGDGSVNTGEFVIPPSTVPTIADSLNTANISWKYYGEHWNLYLQDPNYQNPWNRYCDICNFAQYETSIMADAAQRQEHLKDVTDFYNDISTGALPAVSYVKPSGFLDGHPDSSKFNLFEAFTKKIIDQLQANPSLWATTAIFITVDEGGGYWDSGYIQPLDFFGDGTRIPLIVVSPYSTGGAVSHSYSDHASILKFIEKNWGLAPVSGRSRDNMPNPIVGANPYVPTNSPAISDLTDLFNFSPK
ncbi:MAG TPA: alkaline phosphatase family protein [Terriglobales bacterium]|jgi:phospholipase C